MTLWTFVARFNIVEECRKYGMPLWQCPQFLFVMMGLLIIVSSVFSFILGKQYIDDPQITILFILVLAAILLAISFIITNSFERLAEANRLKTEFISIVSHQLRSPLTNLKWGLDFLVTEGGERPEEKTRYFRMFRENINRMHELVNDLLMVSRVEQGTLPYQKIEFSFDELVKSVLSEFQASIQAANITVKVEGEQGVRLWNDPSLVRHVFANLVDNAIRYAWKDPAAVPSEQRRKNLIVIRYRKTGETLRVEVEDNGVGIPQKDQRYIFEKFFRSTNAVRAQTQGSGLGLYIVKSLVEKAGGRIGFESEENKGSIFWFTLPVKAYPINKS